MPTFADPLKDAPEAAEALRGLAHATRSFDDPADIYAVIGDLLAGVRSLRQVLDQLASTHITHRGRAHDDAGDQAAGATAALAAADELHQAGTLLDTAHDRLDTAMSHSGRIAWHPAQTPGVSEAARTTTHAGSLTLTVWPDTPLGEHQRYAYRIHDTATGDAIEGRDLFTGAGAPVKPGRALRELTGFLSAAGEARQYAIDNPGQHPENEGLFPAWTAEAARRNADALSDLAEHGPQLSASDAVPEPAAVERRWISVVFLQGEEADKVLDLIDRDGPDAAIEHLAGYDYGEETTQAALENGYVYDTPPSGALDRAATRDVYTLTYNPFLGHVSLLREHDARPDPDLLGIDTPEPVPEATVGAAARGSRRDATDWFARAPHSAAAGRGLTL